MIKQYNPQVVHISTEGPLGFFGRKYCLKNNIKFTTSYHTKFPDYVYARTNIMTSDERNDWISMLTLYKNQNEKY